MNKSLFVVLFLLWLGACAIRGTILPPSYADEVPGTLSKIDLTATTCKITVTYDKIPLRYDVHPNDCPAVLGMIIPLKRTMRDNRVEYTMRW